MTDKRQEQLRRAFFRGDELQLSRPEYLREVRQWLAQMVQSDVGAGDCTTKALGLSNEHATARILAKQSGVAAGIDEFCLLLESKEITVVRRVRDGSLLHEGDALVEFSGGYCDLLALERVGLNLLQRMSGVATLTRCWQERIRARNPNAAVVGTRKTPWGLLDKRAVHLGGGGTHRLGLWDAILIKNNHLTLFAAREEEAVVIAIERAWQSRGDAVFVEVEVRSVASAFAAARAFRFRQEKDPDGCPCAVMLDHFLPQQAAHVIEALRDEGLHEHLLVEVSGNISESSLQEYAECGADVLSVGALTHSPPALDLCQRI